MATASKNAWPEQWDTTDALEQLIAQFNAATNYYTPKSGADIKAQAADELAAYYNQQRLAAQQAQERSDLALAQQYSGLQASYDKSREASQKQYNQAYSTADRGLISKGMQRSSYGAQTLANISKQGAEAQQALWDEQTAAEGNINAQRAQLAQQLATKLQQYDVDEATAVLARQRELEDQEYQRGLEAAQYNASLSDTIYKYLLERESAKGSGSTNPNPKDDNKEDADNNPSNLNLFQQFLNSLNGYNPKAASSGLTTKQIKNNQKSSYTGRTNTSAPAATVQTPTQRYSDKWKANTAYQNYIDEQKISKDKVLGRRTAM